MIFTFGKKSLEKYYMLDANLQKVADKALSYGLIDFFIDCSFRNEQDQNKAYFTKKSRVMWPNGKHNKLPSLAMDCVPFVNGKASWDSRHCIFLAGVMQAAAKELGINVRWGGNWDMDGEPITDQAFQDLVHFEEKE